MWVNEDFHAEYFKLIKNLNSLVRFICQVYFVIIFEITLIGKVKWFKLLDFIVVIFIDFDYFKYIQMLIIVNQ